MRRPWLLLFAALLAARAPAFEAGVQYWRPKPGGEISGEHAPASTLDAEQDFGLDEARGDFGAFLILGTDHQLAVDVIRNENTGSASNPMPLFFGNTPLPPGERVETSCELQLLRLAYRYTVGSDIVRGGYQFGLQVADLDLAASAPRAGARNASLSATSPVVGGQLEWSPVPYFSLQFSLVGGSWAWSESSNMTMDVQAFARLHFETFYAGIGYRHVDMHAEDDDIPMNAEMTFSGPAATIGLLF